MSTTPYGTNLFAAKTPTKKPGGGLALPALPPPSSTRGNGKPADVPVPLWDAILKSAKKYGVTPQVLAGIWRVESASTYPNPNANGLGYGGLFGTAVTAPFGTASDVKQVAVPSTQQQADTAASVLRSLIRQKGNLHDALLAYSGGGYYTVPGVTVPRTAAQKVADQQAAQQAQLANPGSIQTGAELSAAKSAALAQVKATQGPWVTLKSNGQFGQAFGEPPANVLKYGGLPVSEAEFNSLWSNTYGNTFEAYTGRPAQPREIADILNRGVSVYTLSNELSQQPSFKSSPIYKQQGAGIVSQAQQALGHAPPPDLVRKAIAENWDSATLQANIRALPAYTKGPEFQQNFAAASDAYKSIYGLPQKQQNDWIKSHVVQGWTSDEIAAKLRSDPAYKYSPEYATKAINFLDAMGMYTGSRSIAAPAMPQAVKQASKGSPLGPLPNPFQVAEGGQ